MTEFLNLLEISLPEALNISLTGIIVVMIILGALAILVVFLSKAIRRAEKTKNKGDGATAAEASPVSVVSNETAPVSSDIPGNALPDNQSAGTLELYRTDEKTAAVVMAIISNESGIPLNKLQFNSIKLIEQNQGGY